MLWQRGKAYSQDLRHVSSRRRIARGTPVGRIAEMLLVSGPYVSKVLIRRDRTGETAARPQCCHVPAKLRDYHTAIRERVAAKPDATLAELRSWPARDASGIRQRDPDVGNPGPVGPDA